MLSIWTSLKICHSVNILKFITLMALLSACYLGVFIVDRMKVTDNGHTVIQLAACRFNPLPHNAAF